MEQSQLIKGTIDFPTREAMSKKDQWPIHESHCCPKHGCKYGDVDCPVVLGLTDKHSDHCESCEYEVEHPNPMDLLEAWAKPTGWDSMYPCAISWLALSNAIERIRSDPKAFAEQGRKEGWWPK